MPHTNLVARDWRALAGFYEKIFGCVPVPPERDYSGSALKAGTAIPGARVRGAHLRLPGHGPNGPSLEIYSYSPEADAVPSAVYHRSRQSRDRPGYGHLAFEVASVEEARREVLASGGRAVGETVTLTTSVSARVTWCCVTDPEGNILELQMWA